QFDPAMFSMVILVDIVLSGDNAIVIGMAAASLPLELRNKAIAYGIAAAILFRIPLAALTYYLLDIPGLKLIGGCLLFYVCYQLWLDLFKGVDLTPEQLRDNGKDLAAPENAEEAKVTSRRFLRAMVTILIADLTMSLDNVLAVAGVARDNLGMLIFGLVLSIALMAVGATLIARLLNKHHWVGYIGLAVIVWVAGNLAWDGGIEVIGYLNGVDG
ncbi:MAG: TerC family protein, partial [Rhodospirillales bacterium]